MDELECEFGSSSPVRFTNSDNVRLYDGNGKQIEIPKCEKCGKYKIELIGMTISKWVCGTCYCEEE